MPDPRQALLACTLAATAVVACAGLVAAAALVPAPPAALPLLIALCIGSPLLAAWELPVAITVLRVRRRAPDEGMLDELREHLDELPETEHPLGY